MKKDIKSFIAIGDIAGRYDELVELVDKANKGLNRDNIFIVGVGDPNDRGKDSRKVIEFFMADKENRVLVQSNHAHMMIDFWENNGTYDDYIFLGNGGIETCKSYGVTITDELERNISMIWSGYHTKQVMDTTNELIADVRIDFIAKVPKEHIEYLKSCPLVFETDEVIISHAPINPTLPIPADDSDMTGSLLYSKPIAFIWNRYSTRRRDKFQIHGHNAHKKVVAFKDSQGCYCLDIDTSRGNILTAVHWPTLQEFSVDYK